MWRAFAAVFASSGRQAAAKTSSILFVARTVRASSVLDAFRLSQLNALTCCTNTTISCFDTPGRQSHRPGRQTHQQQPPDDSTAARGGTCWPGVGGGRGGGGGCSTRDRAAARWNRRPSSLAATSTSSGRCQQQQKQQRQQRRGQRGRAHVTAGVQRRAGALPGPRAVSSAPARMRHACAHCSMPTSALPPLLQAGVICRHTQLTRHQDDHRPI